MKRADRESKNASKQRERAEEIVRVNALCPPDEAVALSNEEVRRLLHELRVHQIELEMQSEELRRAQAELEESRKRYFDLYDLAPVGYCQLSEKGIILGANLASAKLLGIPKSKMIGQPISRFIHKDDQDIYYRHRKQLFATGEPQDCELRLHTKAGTLLWVHLKADLAKGEADGPACRVVMNDITDRKQVEAERERLSDQVEESHQRLKRLTKRLLETMELERKSMARELHDEIGQVFTAINMRLLSLMNTIKRFGIGSESDAIIEDQKALIDNAIQQVKSVSLNLRPVILDDLGIVPALRWHLNQQSERSGIKMEISEHAMPERLDHVVESTCYRVLQEAVTNVMRHSGATEVQVSLECEQESIKMIIHDNGHGFSVDEMMARASHGESLGLLGMRERVELIGGSLCITSTLGNGTYIAATIPLQDPMDA